MFICMHTHIRTCIHASLHTYMHAYIHTHVCIYIHTYIHTSVHCAVHYIRIQVGADVTKKDLKISFAQDKVSALVKVRVCVFV